MEEDLSIWIEIVYNKTLNMPDLGEDGIVIQTPFSKDIAGAISIKNSIKVQGHLNYTTYDIGEKINLRRLDFWVPGWYYAKTRIRAEFTSHYEVEVGTVLWFNLLDNFCNQHVRILTEYEVSAWEFSLI